MVSERLEPSDCAVVPRRIEEAPQALRNLDDLRAKAILTELRGTLEGQGEGWSPATGGGGHRPAGGVRGAGEFDWASGRSSTCPRTRPPVTIGWTKNVVHAP